MESKELYYAVMNIADYLAKKNHISDAEWSTLYGMLGYLSSLGNISIHDLADANNLGDCKSWDDVIIELREQFKKGERV